MDFYKEMTVIIPFLNEGFEIEETIKSETSAKPTILSILTHTLLEE